MKTDGGRGRMRRPHAWERRVPGHQQRWTPARGCPSGSPAGTRPSPSWGEITSVLFEAGVVVALYSGGPGGAGTAPPPPRRLSNCGVCRPGQEAQPGVKSGAAGMKALRSRPWRPPTPRFLGREKTEASRAAAAFCPLLSPVGEWPGGPRARARVAIFPGVPTWCDLCPSQVWDMP